MATSRQVAFINKLADERQHGRTYVQTQLNAWKVETIEDLSVVAASNVIGVLLGEPYAEKREEEPHEEAKPGYYVRGEKAYRVQTNKARTHTYALEWSGTSWEYSPGTGRNLSGLVPMTGEQAALLGLASGRCIACAKVLGGESLSAKVSALIGYGEQCSRVNGWRYPKGVKAQREYLAKHGASVSV